MIFYEIGFAQLSNTPTFCWMVLSKESKTPSFVFGTVHHLGPDPILKNNDLMTFIFKSKVIVEEADTTELLHPAKNHFDFTCDTALDELLGFADYQFVKNEFYRLTGNDLEDYKYILPEVIIQMIEDAKEEGEVNNGKMPLMENALYAVSVFKNIPIKGLETREENFNIMYKSMPLKEQAKLLLYSLKDLQFNRSEEPMRVCFEKQDLTCFCKIDDMAHYTRPGDSVIIVKRNLFWINKIKYYIEHGNAFIAVGAAHLCGDYGIIALLKKNGYAIVPVLTK